MYSATITILKTGQQTDASIYEKTILCSPKIKKKVILAKDAIVFQDAIDYGSIFTVKEKSERETKTYKAYIGEANCKMLIEV